MTTEQLNVVLEKHRLWLKGDPAGERANLRNATLVDADLSGAKLRNATLADTDLSRANLRNATLAGVDLRNADLLGANLSGANLSGADLSGTDLSGADLSGANLSGAKLWDANLRNATLADTDLSGADLLGANLSGANLRNADLLGANLSGANLSGANLRNAAFNETTAFFALSCPESGSFIGYKKCGYLIVMLRITENAKRSSATTRKCRCSEAEVLSITNLDGSPAETDAISSSYDRNFIYKVGEIVRVDNFCEDRWRECAPGIHFFITRSEAVNYL